MAGAQEQASAGRVPFWLHQLVEVLLGMLLLVEGARTGQHTAVLVTLGALLLLLALCSDGALGAWPWIGRRLHRVLDVVAAAVLAVSPVVLGLDHALAIVVLEAAALAMAWMALRTDWRVRGRARARTRKAARAAPAAPPPPSPAPAAEPRPAAPAPRPAEGRPLARKLGAAAGRVRDDGPRTLGRWVGRARDASRAALTPPEEPPTGPPEPGGTSSPG